VWEWVKHHAVEREIRNDCILPEKLNDQANRLAKNALLFAIAGGQIISGDFPFEPVRFKLKGTRICGLIRHALELNWG
jgi:hypothetical protein